MYLRMVFASRPVRRAIAVIETPSRYSSRIIIISPSRTIGGLPHAEDMRQRRLDHSTGASPGGMIRNERRSGNFQSPLSGRIAGPMTHRPVVPLLRSNHLAATTHDVDGRPHAFRENRTDPAVL